MEGRVEHEYLLDVGQHLLDGLVALEVSGVVERSELAVLLPLLQDLGSNDYAVGEAAAVHYAMAYGVYLLQRLDGAVLGVRELFEDKGDAFFVIVDNHFNLLAEPVSVLYLEK